MGIKWVKIEGTMSRIGGGRTRRSNKNLKIKSKKKVVAAPKRKVVKKKSAQTGRMIRGLLKGR